MFVARFRASFEVRRQSFEEADCRAPRRCRECAALPPFESSPNAVRCEQETDDYSRAVQEVSDEGITPAAQFPRTDFCLSNPVDAIACQHMMQIVKGHRTLVRFRIWELEQKTEDTNSERRGFVVADAETVRCKVQVACFLHEEIVGVHGFFFYSRAEGQ
jgi:hypothetical protein